MTSSRLERSDLNFLSVCKGNPVLQIIQSQKLRKRDMLYSSSSLSQTVKVHSHILIKTMHIERLYVGLTLIVFCPKYSMGKISTYCTKLCSGSPFNLARTTLALFLMSLFSSSSSFLFSKNSIISLDHRGNYIIILKCKISTMLQFITFQPLVQFSFQLLLGLWM